MFKASIVHSNNANAHAHMRKLKKKVIRHDFKVTRLKGCSVYMGISTLLKSVKHSIDDYHVEFSYLTF